MTNKFQKVQSNGLNKELQANEVWRIWKNVIVLGFAFMVHFTAFWGASNLQSSINADEALGTFTLASIYGSLILSNIFLPAVVIKLFKCKWTIAISFIAYVPFIAAQFSPRFLTMIPAGLLVGLGGGPLWCAKCTYLTLIAESYASITGIATEIVVTRFFGVFFTFYQLSQVWGNLISSTVFSLSSPSEQTTEYFLNVSTAPEFLNITSTTMQNIENMCGANFCPAVSAASNPNLEPPPAYKIQIISAIYLGCITLACIAVAVGVDPLRRYSKDRDGTANGMSGLKLLGVTVKQLSNPYQLLIVPITMFIGAEQAFMAADYSASFVSCGWGISNIGYVMICFGVSNAISSLAAGGVIKKTGRSPVIAAALALHAALLITLLIWKPHPGNKIIFFVIAGLWGAADAVWLVQVSALTGVLFPGKEEAAYSNFRLWEATGSVITYIYSPYLCTHVKIYLLIGLLLIGVSGYTGIEFMERKAKAENIDQRRGKFELVDNSLKPADEIVE